MAAASAHLFPKFGGEKRLGFRIRERSLKSLILICRPWHEVVRPVLIPHAAIHRASWGYQSRAERVDLEHLRQPVCQQLSHLVSCGPAEVGSVSGAQNQRCPLIIIDILSPVILAPLRRARRHKGTQVGQALLREVSRADALPE